MSNRSGLLLFCLSVLLATGGIVPARAQAARQKPAASAMKRPPAAARTVARPAGGPLPIAGLDSLSSATLHRALDYLEIAPRDLGFDKLYADDDTFRLSLIEDILGDPLRIPGFQTDLLDRIRPEASSLDALPRLVRILADVSEAPIAEGAADTKADPAGTKANSKANRPASAAPDSIRSLLSSGAPYASAVHAFVARCRNAEGKLDAAFRGLTEEDRRKVLVLAPAFWGDSEDPADKTRKGALHRELGLPADTTFKWNEDPVLDAAVKLDRRSLSRASLDFIQAAIALKKDVDGILAGSARPGAFPIGGKTGTGGDQRGGPNGGDQRGGDQRGGDQRGGDQRGGESLPGVDGSVLAAYETPWGLLVVGGDGDNIYSEDALRRIAFLIEPGGDDVYRGRAASAVGGLLRPFSLLVDEAGDDQYLARETTFAVGGAVFGVSALLDCAGNDVYRADDGSLGGAFFGSALLYDGGGSDLFEGRNLCEGSGAFGIGALISQAGPEVPPQPELEEDRGYKLGLIKVPGTGAGPLRWDENDTYLCARQSQGFASTFGIGLLFDAAGNDTYRSGGRYLHKPLLPDDYQSLSQGFSIGFRPRAGGGIGILCDEEGNDFYDAEVYSQGASYWYSLGLLFDGRGNDRYLATQYSQGAGIHLSIGSLWDRGGDDHYVCKLGVTQGTAHDLGVGWQLDEGGNDFYIVSDGQGMSITDSDGIFIDGQGNDVYATPGVGQGALTWARGFCGPAIFLDLEGKDLYPRDAPSKNGSAWSSDLYAIGIDLDRDIQLPGEIIPEPVLTAADSARSVEELFDTASLWEVGSARERVKRARAALLTKPHEAMLFAVNRRLDSQDGLVYRVLLDVGKAQPDSFAKRVIPRLADRDQYVQRNVIALLGEMKRKDAREPLEAMLRNPKQEKHWTRIIQALGNIGDPAARPAVRPFLRDAKERRRIQSAVALGALKDTLSVGTLVSLLQDEYSTVRSAASQTLVSFRAAAIPELVTACAPAIRPGRPDRAVVLRTLGLAAAAVPDTAKGTDLLARGEARRALLSALDLYARPDGAPERAAAVDGLIRVSGAEGLPFLRLRMQDEPDPLVKRTFEKGEAGLKKD